MVIEKSELRFAAKALASFCKIRTVLAAPDPYLLAEAPGTCAWGIKEAKTNITISYIFLQQ